MNKKLLLAAVAAVLLMCAVIVYGAYASGVPEGVEVFTVDDHICVLANTENGVALECFCPCEEVNCVEPTEDNRENPTSTPPSKETPPVEPTNTPVPPTPTVIPPTDTPEPDPTEKPKCNRGLGNNEEGCDPGNSGGKPGAAGEDNEPSGPPGQDKKKDK